MHSPDGNFWSFVGQKFLRCAVYSFRHRRSLGQSGRIYQFRSRSSHLFGHQRNHHYHCQGRNLHHHRHPGRRCNLLSGSTGPRSCREQRAFHCYQQSVDTYANEVQGRSFLAPHRHRHREQPLLPVVQKHNGIQYRRDFSCGSQRCTDPQLYAASSFGRHTLLLLCGDRNLRIRYQ